MTRTVCMFVTNSVNGDPRVRREAATLAKNGYQVVVIGLRGSGDCQEEWLDGFKVIRVEEPKLLTIRQGVLAALERLSPRLLVRVRSVYRLIRYGCRNPVVLQTRHEQGKSEAKPAMPLTAWQKTKTDQLSIRFITRLNVEMARVAIQQRADLYHSHDLDTLLAGYLAKRRTGNPLLYDFHELYTEQFPKGIKSPLWHFWYAGLEWILLRGTDYRITVCVSLGEWAARRYRVEPPVTVMNVPNARTVFRIPAQTSQEKVILFHGMYMPDRGLERLIEAAQYIRGGRIVFRGFGSLEGRLRELSRQAGVENVVSFKPPVPMAELVEAAGDADIGVIPYLPVCLNNEFCLPNKIFEYMMAGLAVVGSDLPELRRIILGHDVGLIYDPYSSKDLARALNELLADPARLEKMRRNSLQAAQDKFNWACESQKLLRLYDTAVGLA